MYLNEMVKSLFFPSKYINLYFIRNKKKYYPLDLYIVCNIQENLIFK